MRNTRINIHNYKRLLVITNQDVRENWVGVLALGSAGGIVTSRSDERIVEGETMEEKRGRWGRLLLHSYNLK